MAEEDIETTTTIADGAVVVDVAGVAAIAARNAAETLPALYLDTAAGATIPNVEGTTVEEAEEIIPAMNALMESARRPTLCLERR